MQSKSTAFNIANTINFLKKQSTSMKGKLLNLPLQLVFTASTEELRGLAQKCLGGTNLYESPEFARKRFNICPSSKKIQVKNQVASCQFLLDFADEDSNKKGFGQCPCQ
jgi:hypothetical protein